MQDLGSLFAIFAGTAFATGFLVGVSVGSLSLQKYIADAKAALVLIRRLEQENLRLHEFQKSVLKTLYGTR